LGRLRRVYRAGLPIFRGVDADLVDNAPVERLAELLPPQGLENAARPLRERLAERPDLVKACFERAVHVLRGIQHVRAPGIDVRDADLDCDCDCDCDCVGRLNATNALFDCRTWICGASNCTSSQVIGWVTCRSR